MIASLTKEGSVLINRAISGETLTFTRMEYGNGIIAGYDSAATVAEKKELLSSATALVSKKADIGIYSVKTKNDYSNVVGKLIIDSITEVFYGKELGVFAKIGDEEETLVFYSADTESPEKIDKDEIIGQEFKISVEVFTGNAENITINYSPDLYVTEEDFNIHKEQNAGEHTDLLSEIASLKENDIESIRTSLLLTRKFDHVVDSNESLLEWANCKDGSMKSVLVKSGTYTLDGKMINLTNSGTKCVVAEPENKIIVQNYFRGIGATANYDAVIHGLNIELNYDVGDSSVYPFYRGMICYNCTAKGSVSGTSDGGKAYGFYECTCIKCRSSIAADGTGTYGGWSVGFYSCNCNECYSDCRSFAKATGPSGNAVGFYDCICSNCESDSDALNQHSSSQVYSEGFYQCTCSNCIARVSIGGIVTSNELFAVGFINCSNLNNCEAYIICGNQLCYGFKGCSNLNNCIVVRKGFNNPNSYGGLIAFYNCECINNCSYIVDDDYAAFEIDYGYSECMFCSNCISRGSFSYNRWSNSNVFVDNDSCQGNSQEDIK